MKGKVLVFFLFCSVLVTGQENYQFVRIGQDMNSVQVISSSNEGIILQLNIGSFYIRKTEITNEIYHSVFLDGEALIKEKGFPELPKVSRSIIIPGKTKLNIRILSAEYKEVKLPVRPSRGILPRTINPDDVPYTFSSVYSEDAYYPVSRYKPGNPYMIRDVRGGVIDLYPFAYNPVREILRIYTSLMIEINLSGKNNSNTEIHINRYFEPLLRNHFINYQDNMNSQRYQPVIDTGRMLVICYDDFLDEIQPFVNFKNNRGMPTDAVSMSVVGSTASDIQTYIQNYYTNDNSLTFVVLVGDHTQVPSLSVGGGGSDPSFSLVSGSDNYPDIIIGRFSATDASQVSTMVNRSIAYENMPAQNWFHHGIGIASADGTGDGDDGEWDWEHLRNIRTDLMGYHYTSVAELYEGSQGGEDAPGNPNSGMVSTLVNAGVSIVNYTGHGSTTSWSTTGFSNSNVNALVNDSMLPFIFSVACVNGNFTGSTCFAETWLRATNSSTGEPTGAIGFYGSSINQDWDPPMEAQDEFNDLLVNEDNITFGALCYNGSCSMMDKYGSENGSSGANMFLTWHIFGDPSISVIPNNHGYCKEVLTISDSIIGGHYEFQASDSIIAASAITGGADVHFGATNIISFLPGFKADTGSSLIADLNGCCQVFVNPINTMVSTDSIYRAGIRAKQPLQSVFSADSGEPVTIKIYPNPVRNGKIYMEYAGPEEPQSIVIYNSFGTIIYLNNKPDKLVIIDSVKDKGLLFIKIIFKNTAEIRKVISI